MGKNVQSMIKTIEGRMLYEAVALARDVKIIRVLPSEWQGQMLGRTKPRKTVKKLSIMRILGVYKQEVSEDEADAINLGEYYLNNLKTS